MLVKDITLGDTVLLQTSRRGFNSIYSSFQTSWWRWNFFVPTEPYMVPDIKADLPPPEARSALLSSHVYPEPTVPQPIQGVTSASPRTPGNPSLKALFYYTFLHRFWLMQALRTQAVVPGLTERLGAAVKKWNRQQWSLQSCFSLFLFWFNFQGNVCQ